MPRRYQRARSYRENSSRRGKLSWRVFQLNKQFKRRLRLLGMAVAVLISTALLFASLSLYHYLKKPLVAAAKSDVAAAEPVVFARAANGRSRWDLLLLKMSGDESQVENLAVLTLDPSENSLTLLQIPLNLLPEPVPASPSLASLQRGVMRLLGVSLDGYLWLAAEGERKLQESLGEPLTFSNWRKLVAPWGWSKLPTLASVLREDMRTNLSFLDIFNLARQGAAVRFDRFREVTLTVAFFSNPGKSEQFLRETFAEVGMTEEGARILVLNGTPQPGLAAKGARLLTHLGGYVLDVNNASRNDYAESLLIGGEKTPYTRRRLTEVFDVAKFYDVAAFASDPLFSYMQRADVVLILGLDSVARL